VYLASILGAPGRDVRYAIRSLRKDLRFSLVAFFALALGIGASTVVFSVFYNLLFNALAAKNADRLVVPVIEDVEHPNLPSSLFVSGKDLNYLRRNNQTFEGFVGYRWGHAIVQ